MDSTQPNPLGRIYIEDGRDERYMMTRAMAAEAPDEKAAEALERGYRYWWADGWWGDQWYTPWCVAYTWIHLVEDGPITHPTLTPNRAAAVEVQGNAIIRPSTLYTQAQDLDEWEGTNYDGTSNRAAAKALQARGFVGAYRRIYDVETLADTILTHGPVPIGVNWYTEMFTPDPETGEIVIGGRVEGGHAVLINGASKPDEMFRFKNSWGRDWGRKGFGYISFDNMQRLLNEHGDAYYAEELASAA